MPKKLTYSAVVGVISFLIFGAFSECAAYRFHNLGSPWNLQVDPSIRLSYNLTQNTGDLKTSDEDKLEYAAYIYKIPIDISYGEKIEFFVNITSEGPSRYAAPFSDIQPFIEGFGVRKDGSSNSMLYPAVDEVWLKIHPLSNFSLTGGQSPYVVGNGYALGGQYNNYGLTAEYNGPDDKINARLRYSILDFENKLYGFRKDTLNKWNMSRNADSNAFMVAADMKFKIDNHTIQPYVGLLYDETSRTRRAQYGYFANFVEGFPVDHDELITFGVSANMEFPYFSFEFETAKNVGKTYSADSSWDSIDHEGYLFHVAAKGYLGMFTPRAKLVVASGNKVNTDDVEKIVDGTLRRTKNNSFAVFSPLNTNLVDSYAHSASVPVVAMAGGYPMNYGIRRPGVYNDSHVWENIIAYNLGLNFSPSDKALIMFDFWVLRAKESGIGQTVAGGDFRRLSKDLGQELDVYATYSLFKFMTVGLHGGYFMPGKYYETERFDSNFLWNYTMSQTSRTDGRVNDAYQLEIFTVLHF